jgi:hypothetical protein
MGTSITRHPLRQETAQMQADTRRLRWGAQREDRWRCGASNNQTLAAWVVRAQTRVLFLILFLGALSACSSTTTGVGPKLVNHSFSFNGKPYGDKWAATADLLEYSYGDQYRMVGKKALAPEDSLGPQSGISGPMPVGEFLYVKWRIKATGDVLENRVDLRPLLPKDMTGHELIFVIDSRQLYVYLATPTPKHEDDPPILKTTESRYYVTYEIYPTNTYAKR